MLEHLATDPALPVRSVVVGAAGFVGSAITERLRLGGAGRLALTRKDVDLLAAGASARLAGELEAGDALVFVSALAPCKDIPTLMKNLAMADAVCSAIDRVELSQLVYISSDAVYSDRDNPLREESCADPENLHGMMHRARELMLQTSARAPFAILRPSLLYGAADPHNGYGPNRFRRLAAAGEPIELFGEGEEQRDHVFIDDLAELVVRVLARRSRGVLNVATGRATSFRHVAEEVVAQSGCEVPVRFTPRKNPITHRHFDPTATLKAFPDFRYTPLVEGLRRAAAEEGRAPTCRD